MTFMSNKSKEIILKTLLVLSVVLMFLFVPGSFIMSFLIPSQKIFNIYFYTVEISLMTVGLTVMILIPIFGHTLQKKIPAKKIPLPYRNYDELINIAERSLERKQYLKQQPVKFDDKELTLYIKSTKIKLSECFVIAKVSELCETDLEQFDAQIFDILTNYFDREVITDTFKIILVICVERITPSFQHFVNSNIQQDIKARRLPVGITFGSHQIYIAQQKDGFAITNYKHLVKEFTDIMQLEQSANSSKPLKGQSRESR